jgi:hypothetical protein
MGIILKILGCIGMVLGKIFFPEENKAERLWRAEEKLEIMQAREEAKRAMDAVEGAKTDEELDKKLREGKF